MFALGGGKNSYLEMSSHMHVPPLLELEMMSSVYFCFNLNPEPSSKDSNVKNSTARPHGT